MKKRVLKISVLALILAITVAFSASCSIFSMFLEEDCTHENIKDGDCLTPGVCADCGEPVGELGPHDYVSETVAPSCTEAGYTNYLCKVCKDSYRVDGDKATGHSFGEWIFTKQPTSTEKGEMYRECSVCSAKENLEVDPHVHTMVNGTAKAVTCTTDGWDAYEYCTQCAYSTKVIIVAIGHNYGNYVSIGNGMHSRTCANDPSHVVTEPCSGGSVSGGSLPICAYCNTTYEIAVRPGNSTYGYYTFAEYAPYTEGMQKLYKDLTAACEEFIVEYANKDLAPDEDGNYLIGEEYNVDDYEITLDVARAVWKVFYVSSPVYYWLDASILTATSSSGESYIYLSIADDYAKASDRKTADAAITAMTNECNALIEDGMTDLEKAMTITAYIVGNMEYAYDEYGQPEEDMWAHCMAGFAEEGYGVCEAYAKSFMYLCLLNGVDCVMGSGDAGEPHAWNYVKIGGEWYGADLTWTDNSGDEAVYDYFGLSESKIFSDHTPHSSVITSGNFMYAAPELSDKSLEITELYKDGEYVGVYKSIDDAFAVMTDENGDYEIYVGFYGFFTTSPAHYLDATTTPDVGKLTITGKYEPGEEGYLATTSVIYISKALTLGSNVEIKNLDVDILYGVGACPINLAGHTLTLSGEGVYIQSKVCGTEVGSTVVTTTVQNTYFYGGADIYRLVVNNNGVVFAVDSSIKYCNSYNLYVIGNVNIDVDVFE